MTRTIIALVSALSLLAIALPMEAYARQCDRTCVDGVCWYNCSKIPGQKNVFRGL